jgi:transposase
MSQPENQDNRAAPESPIEPRESLPTIWEASDALWEKLFLPLLTELDPPSPMGRPRADQRQCLDGMIYRARTGCQWNHLPTQFGSDSTVHRTVCRWDSKGVFDRLWAVLIYHCEELQAVHWEWQAADGCLNKARFIGKKGAKANRARHRKTVQKTIQKKTYPKTKASVLTPPTVAGWASSKACLLRSEAARFLSASQART